MVILGVLFFFFLLLLLLLVFVLAVQLEAGLDFQLLHLDSKCCRWPRRRR